MKPRYNYGWDWCPRFVPIGIWGELTLEYGDSLSFELTDVESELKEDNTTGRLSLAIDADGDVSSDEVELVAVLMDGNDQIACVSRFVTPGEHTLDFEPLSIEPWWPNMMGQAKVYELKVSAIKNDQTVWSQYRNIGFKRIKWLPCQDAPAEAKPWICEVNGMTVFLQGVNWTPLDANYIDTPDEQYEEVISLYCDMGCNIFRVWGGGIIEKEVFYQLCDQNGILVWQDFPMSSSGIENYPPDDEAFISDLTVVAKSYIHRLKHHVSLLLWSGGNELTERDKVGTPIDKNHPCIVAMRKVVEEYDASRRFVETSPSGPRFQAHPDDYGKGMHHDVHGPWGFDAKVIRGLDAWFRYWKDDDALFRSEVGMPGAANLETIKQYDDGMVWPPEGAYWFHTAAWWTQWKQFKPILQDKSEESGLPEYIRLTQEQQAKAYEVAAKRCKERFPQCGGFIIWMGHDSFPCPANNSVIDYARKIKPAYYALKDIFRNTSHS
jgi:beta-mannosidase